MGDNRSVDLSYRNRKMGTQRRTRQPGPIFLLLVLAFCTPDASLALSSQNPTLGEIKQEFLGNEVIIFGTKASGFERLTGGKEVFLDWHIAGEEKPGHYLPRVSEYAAYSYKGQRGRVIAIELAESLIGPRTRGTTTDVFGDPVSDDQVVNPYLHVIVRMGDGHLIANTTYASIVRHYIELARIIEAERREVLEKIDSLAGRQLWSVAYSVIYQANVSMSTLTDSLKAVIYKMRDVPNLTPMIITKAQYLEGEHAIIAKVSFQTDRNGILFLPYRWYGPISEERKALPFLEKITGGPHGVLTKIPASLDKAEIEAIRTGSIIRGMSKEALRYSIGFPDKENDWGAGGKQLIYGKALLVYMRGGIVVDWQSLGQ